MKKIVFVLFIAFAAMTGCKKASLSDPESDKTIAPQKGNPAHTPNIPSGNGVRYGRIDINYSRECTHYGGGCCLILEWWEWLDLQTASFFEQIAAAGNAPFEDSERGPIAFSVAGNDMRLSFFRDLEERTFKLDTEIRITGPLAEYLGYNAITLHPGNYELDRSRLQYGEAIVNATFE
jgi:hypothetical protein